MFKAYFNLLTQFSKQPYNVGIINYPHFTNEREPKKYYVICLKPLSQKGDERLGQIFADIKACVFHTVSHCI